MCQVTNSKGRGPDVSASAMRGLCLSIVMLLATAWPALAQSKVGTTAGDFLEIGTGARYIALGESAVATADDAAALYWNPAGIVNVGLAEVSFQHTSWFAGTSLQYAAGVVRAGGGYVGAHFYLMSSGEMDVTTLEFEDGTGETFDVQDVALGLSYARRLTDSFNLGGTVKYVGSRVFRMNASTIALDIGAQYKTPFDNVTLGFGIFNFGGELQLDGDNTTVRTDLDPNTSGDNDGLLSNLATQSWELPLIFRLGVAYDLQVAESATVRVSSDALFPNNNNQYVNLGAEITLLDLLHLRAGASNLFLDDTFGQGHLRLGAGVTVSDFVRADFAYADRGDLGGVNTIGASVRF